MTRNRLHTWIYAWNNDLNLKGMGMVMIAYDTGEGRRSGTGLTGGDGNDRLS